MKRLIVSLVVATMLVAMVAVPALAQSAKVFVNDVSPEGGSNNVDAGSNISATFNMRMTRTTINNKTFYLKQQDSSAVVPAQVTYHATTKTATLNPDADLAYGATYTAYVKGGRLGVKGADDQRLGGTTDPTATFANAKVSWTFSVAPPPPPPPDTTIDSGPSSLVNSRSASFNFSSSEANSSFECSLDGVPFEPCTSPITVPDEDLLADGQHNFRVRAINAAGNADPTPDTWTWTVDATGPNASITDGPPKFVNSRSVTFTFAGAEDGGGYKCNIDGPGPSTEIVSACTSVETEDSLADGTYTLTVWASDALGNFGTPARHTWTVDTVAPAAPGAHLDASSDSGSKNDNTTKDNTPTISGTAEAGSIVKIYDAQNNGVPSVTADNAGTWSYTFGALTPDGSYSYTVKTTDAAGNESQGTSISLTIDTLAPETTLGDKPASPLNSGSATFTFSSSENSSSFECSRDGSAFTGCTSPQSNTGLADGSHTFRVRAIDAADNVDPTPASHTWTVETAAPTITNFSPANTEADVAPSTNVRVTFSEAMDKASVEAPGTFTLKQGSSSPIAATVTYDSATKKATLDPSTDLALNTTYTATLTTEAKDLTGSALAQERSWNFTTANAPRRVTVTPTTLDLSVTQSNLFESCEKSALLTVTNNGQNQVEFWDVDIAGPDAQNFSTGSQNLLAIYDWLGLPGGYYFQDTVTFKAGQDPGDRSRSYFATLTYKDDTGATIGNPVTLTARAACLSVG